MTRITAYDITVFRRHLTTAETCAYGCPHEVGYFDVQTLTPTGRTREHDNGYVRQQTPLFVDAQGRIYHKHIPIDFSGNTSYVRDGDSACYMPSPGIELARDLDGHPLNDSTPAGPPVADVADVARDQSPRRAKA